MLSNHSFNALLKTLEEPPPHVKFLLATTDPQKLPVTILSRCLQFNLRRLSQDLIQGHLQHLVNEEGLQAEQAALHQLARAADGSMRDALSLLDQAIAFVGGKLLDSEVRSMLGSIEQTFIYDLVQALADADGRALLQQVQQVSTQVPDYGDVLADLITALHHIAILQQVPSAYDEAMGDRESLSRFAEQLSVEDVQLYYQIGLVGRRDMNMAPDPRTGLEMVLLRMLAFRPANTNLDYKPQEKKTFNKVREVPVSEPQTSISDITIEVKPQAVVAKVVESDNTWATTVESLDLVGVLKQLAMHCVVKHQEDDVMQLALEPANEYLYTKERQDRLQDALSVSSGKAIRLSIELEKSQLETPAEQGIRHQQAKQDAAEQAIKGDENVQKIIETFNATVDENSIQPVD